MNDPLFFFLVLATFVAIIILTIHRRSEIKAEEELREANYRRLETQKWAQEQEKLRKKRDNEQSNQNAKELKAEAKRLGGEKRQDEHLRNLVNLGAGFGIVEINLDLAKMPYFDDQVTVAVDDGIEQFVDLHHLTCTCGRFQSDKINCSKTHGSRLCEHLFKAIDERSGFTWATDLEHTLLQLSTREVVQKAYSFWHPYDGWFFIIIGKDSYWLSVFHRDTGNSAEWSSYARSGWNLKEKRWSYGDKLDPSGDLTKLLRKTRDFEDFHQLAEARLSKTEDKIIPLSARSHPANNPNFNSDKFGPEKDAYDRPLGIIINAIEFEGRIIFNYVDSKQQESRRTVFCRELQTYRTEGNFLYAFCDLRKDGRTFDICKMSNISDVETGEVILDINDYVEFQNYHSITAQLRRWAEENEPLAKAWLYLFQANKKPSKAEYNVLKSTFSEQLNNVELSTDSIRRYHDFLTIPTAIGFQRSVASVVKRHPDKLDLFANTARKLVNVRKSPNFADLAALDYMEERITKGK